MIEIEVRCGCDASKVLGYVPLRRDVRPGERVCFVLRRPVEPLPAGWGEIMREPAARKQGIQRLCLDVGTVAIPIDGGRDTQYVVALKSRDLPLAVLRRIPGFSEQRRVHGMEGM